MLRLTSARGALPNGKSLEGKAGNLRGICLADLDARFRGHGGLPCTALVCHRRKSGDPEVLAQGRSGRSQKPRAPAFTDRTASVRFPTGARLAMTGRHRLATCRQGEWDVAGNDGSVRPPRRACGAGSLLGGCAAPRRTRLRLRGGPADPRFSPPTARSGRRPSDPGARSRDRRPRPAAPAGAFRRPLPAGHDRRRHRRPAPLSRRARGHGDALHGRRRPRGGAQLPRLGGHRPQGGMAALDADRER